MVDILRSEKPAAFIDKCLAGTAHLSDIDDFVAAWHRGEGLLTLRESLGFTQKEYALWVEEPRSADAILLARSRKLPLAEAKRLAAQAAVAVGHIAGERGRPSLGRSRGKRQRNGAK